jgi:hypothetical protein
MTEKKSLQTEVGLVRNRSTRHGVLQALNSSAVSATVSGIALVLTVMLDQGVQLVAAGVQSSSQMQRNVGHMIGMSLAKLIRPLLEKLPFVSAFFGDFDGILVHINRSKNL